MMRTFLLLLMASILGADTYPRQPGIDALHYAFQLELRDDTDEIEGEATIRLRFTQAAVSEVTLDLADAMHVVEVTSNAAPVAFQRQSQRLVISVQPAPAAGERRRFTVRYQGKPAEGLRILKNKFGDRVFFSENWPNHARGWLPMIDHPYDKATSEFLVTAPIRYQVVANGLLQEETDLGDGRRFTHWKQSVPIASWLNALGVAQFAFRQFASVQGIQLSTWVFHQDRENGIVTFETPAKEAMDFFISHIGPFPYEKLANIEASGFNGGTEHASAIFYGEKAIDGRPATRLVAHEIAHQWFGDSVTEKDWDDVWLSEGFATYFTLLCKEHYSGRDAFREDLRTSRDGVFALEKKLPGEAVQHNNLADMSKVLNQIIYQKGGWTLHMLRVLMGDDAFWAGIREYYGQYRDTNASTTDFRRVMEEHAGVKLDWFFDQWLRRPGSPTVLARARYDAASKKLTLDFTQKGEPYRLPVEVRMQVGEETRLTTLELTQGNQSFTLAAERKPTSIELDPNVKLLAHLSLEF